MFKNDKFNDSQSEEYKQVDSQQDQEKQQIEEIEQNELRQSVSQVCNIFGFKKKDSIYTCNHENDQTNCQVNQQVEEEQEQEYEKRTTVYIRNSERDSTYINPNFTLGHTKDDELKVCVDEYKKLLEGNKKFVALKTKEDPDFFKKLAQGQSPSILLIGCADSRVPPDQLTQTQPGQIFIHRNVANVVNLTDMNVLSVIQFAVEVLKVKHIIVMGHTQCGGVKASMTQNYHGLIDHWLFAVKDVALKHYQVLSACKTEEEKLRKMIELNVQESALNVCKTSFVQKAWAKNQSLHVHGWITELETGKIIDLKIHKKLWKDIEQFYSFDFNEN